MADNAVAVVSDIHQSKYTILEKALDEAQFWQEIDVVCNARFEGNKQEFPIIIKVDLEFYCQGQATCTDPQLVEHLVDLLFAKGYKLIKIAASPDNSDLWLENRNVYVLADILGYQYSTQHQNNYEIIDLSEDLQAADFPEGSSLFGSKLSSALLEPSYLITFSANKTHQQHLFSLGLSNFLNILPLRDKRHYYAQHSKEEDIACVLMDAYPADFSIIDAIISNHGNTASYANAPVKTATVIAGKSLLLCDEAAANKMGLSLGDSTLYSQFLKRKELPTEAAINRSVSVYPQWVNVDSFITASVRYRKQSFFFENLLEPFLYRVDADLFPFKEPVQEHINEFVSRRHCQIDTSAQAYSQLLCLNFFVYAIHSLVNKYNIQFNKDALWHKKAPLNLDVDNYSHQDYRNIENYLQTEYRAFINQVKGEERGLTWTYHDDGSILFQYRHRVAMPFDAFVKVVDVSKSIQYMNDYIGGVIVPVRQDKQNRNTLQVERNIYLTQPNYLALTGGIDIDVSKLQSISYKKNEHKIVWKTVYSENQSAEYDDGWVSFKRREDDTVDIHIFGRQLFTLPLFWKLINIDNYPAIKSSLVKHAYETFFANTAANFEAVAEGRDVRIGKPFDDIAMGEMDDERKVIPGFPNHHEMASIMDKLEEYINLKQLSEFKFSLSLFKKRLPEPYLLDENGFAHFEYNNQDVGTTPLGQEINSILTDTSKQILSETWTDFCDAIDQDMLYLKSNDVEKPSFKVSI